ncbi:MAG: hypothetical protein JOZ81_08035 [Chloroflexi bacterium]|nr:hypothetical protein [Chloroflexota bacterium]
MRRQRLKGLELGATVWLTQQLQLELPLAVAGEPAELLARNGPQQSLTLVATRVS